MKLKFVKTAVLSCLLFSVFALVMFNACNKSSDTTGGNTSGTSNSVSIKNFAFVTASLTVKPGTTVTWTNNDATTHTVTADDGSFDSGNIPVGGTFTHTFSAAGTVAYHCSIHTTMKANIVVSN